MLDKPIMPITYNKYWQIWNKTIDAAGCREAIRPYATRVGAGGKIDGRCSFPLATLPKLDLWLFFPVVFWG